MDGHEALPLAVAGVIVLATLLTGPAVGLWTPPATDDRPPLGTGTADVSVVSTPQQGRLAHTEFGTRWYRLRLPPARVAVENVTGRPLVEYRLYVPALRTDQIGTTFLTPAMNGSVVSLPMDDWRFDPDSIDRARYRAELTLVYRGSDGERTLYAGNVTLEVTG